MEKTIRKTSIDVVNELLQECDMDSGISILEPSAGSGDLVNGILLLYPFLDLDIDCIELNKEKREQLISKGFNVVGEDFMKFTTDKEYDLIIACPTFKDNVDVEHIIHMYRFLKIGGSLVSLTSPHWTTKNSERQTNFRSWLMDKDYKLKMLKDCSFVENYKTQPTMLIKITK